MRYSIIESCIRPSGSWAHTFDSFTDEQAARDAFARAYFVGPEYGTVYIWSKTLTLRYSYFADGTYHSDVLAERKIS